ncbi:MAG: ferrous iron transport protein A [Bdellovibrionales bacterium]|nr:ferrous iron transport protein A [Bdellovibrionales bacterium]
MAPRVELLGSLPVGTLAFIVEISGNSASFQRLRDLGCIPGQAIRVLRAGSVKLIAFGGAKYAVRAIDIDNIQVIRNPVQ